MTIKLPLKYDDETGEFQDADGSVFAFTRPDRSPRKLIGYPKKERLSFAKLVLEAVNQKESSQ